MLPFFHDVISPMLEAFEPASVVEIGSEHGKMTRKLCGLVGRWGGTVHAVDPAPLFDPAVWTRDLAPVLVVHPKRSLEALPEIPSMNAVLIDGDHNWFTVLEELLAVEKLTSARGEEQPLVFLHDVAWPYGRRDLYYDPSTIPEEHRQPYARRGMSPAASELLPSGGMNAHLANATHEGGPKNGVLTAIEDYMKQSELEFLFAKIPAAFGLAVLLPKALVARAPALEKLLSPWMSPHVEAFVDRLETARIAMLTGARG